MSKKEVEIRKDLRSVLKNFSREELLSQWYHFSWRDEEKIKQAKEAMDSISNEQIMKMILDRDVRWCMQK